MSRAELAHLLQTLSTATGGMPLIIVGSQSAHGQVGWLPSAVTMSIEVDVFLKPDSGVHRRLRLEYGMDSPYHAAHGVYADPLGAGIVSLPPGWEERLVTLTAEDGSVTWQALEIHDTAVSKLMAGRAKDWSFLCELLFAGSLKLDLFLQRALLMRDTVHAGALRPRLEGLAAELRERKMRALIAPVEAAARGL
jgi:hypothetical protein